MIKAVILDVGESQSINEDTTNLIAKILDKKYFCIISTDNEELLQKQFQPLLNKNFNEKNFLISATNGAALFAVEDKELKLIYKEYLTKQEKEKIEKIINALASEFWLRPVSKDAGSLIKDEASQITLSCFGQQAPNNLKEKWDPDKKIRNIMLKWIYSDKKKKILDTKGIGIEIGGTTSIKFTKERINKKFGIKKILEYLDLNQSEAVFLNTIEMNKHLQKIVEEI